MFRITVNPQSRKRKNKKWKGSTHLWYKCVYFLCLTGHGLRFKTKAEKRKAEEKEQAERSTTEVERSDHIPHPLQDSRRELEEPRLLLWAGLQPSLRAQATHSLEGGSSACSSRCILCTQLLSSLFGTDGEVSSINRPKNKSLFLCKRDF